MKRACRFMTCLVSCLLVTAGDSAARAAATARSAQPLSPTYRIVAVQPTNALPFSSPLGMNDQGAVVGYAGPEAYSPFSAPIVVDLEGNLTLLPSDRDGFGFAHGINDGGVTIVGEAGFRPHYWTAGIRTQLPVPEGFFSGVARAIGPSGIIVGSWADYDDPLPPNPVGPRPCYWPSTADQVVPLRTLSPRFPGGLALDVNGAGQITGSVSSAKGLVAAIWNSPRARPVNLGMLPGAVLGEARAINENGSVAGRCGFPNGQGKAFRWSAGARELEELPSLTQGTGYAEAWDLNDAGDVVGFSNAGGEAIHAILWSGGQVIDLNDCIVERHPVVSYLASALAISESGIIAAEAVPTSATTVFDRVVAILVPVTGFARSGEPAQAAGRRVGVLGAGSSHVHGAARPTVLRAGPNPIEEEARIRFSLGRPGRTRLDIFDVSGRLVRTLADREFPAGDQLVTWDRRSEVGTRAAAGVYFIRLRLDRETETRRVVIVSP